MTLTEYLDAIRNNEFSMDPKQQLWQAVYKGDFVKFKELIDANNTSPKDISEYRSGITLLHLLVYMDQICHFTKVDGRQRIAQALLNLGADLNAPAKEAAFGINIGQTPWQMAKLYDSMPWYYCAGIRGSFIYTGEHVLPIFKKHLGVEQAPSMLTQFSDVCTRNERPLAALATTAIAAATVAAVKYSRGLPPSHI